MSLTRRGLVIAFIGIVLGAAAWLVLQRQNDPYLENLRRQLDIMVEEMDRQERLPHNPILSSTYDKHASNPFAQPEAGLHRNTVGEKRPQAGQAGTAKSQTAGQEETKATK